MLATQRRVVVTEEIRGNVAGKSVSLMEEAFKLNGGAIRKRRTWRGGATRTKNRAPGE